MLQAIFECYPATSVRPPQPQIEQSHHSALSLIPRYRTVDSMIMFAKDFNICPQLIELPQYISLLTQELKRDTVASNNNLLISFSQV